MKKQNKWTVMIYMAGDNNLSVDMSYALENLRQKVALQEGAQINLFVYFENNSPEIPAIYCDFSDSQNPTYVDSNEIVNKVSNSLFEVEQSEVATVPLLNFVRWCVEKSNRICTGDVRDKAADGNFALILSGHTMGFLSMGLLREESKNQSMTMSGLQRALETITSQIIGKKLSILGFDSCVMGMLEVGSQFQNVSETMIASEGTIPNAGWAYTEIFDAFTNSDVKSTPDIAEEIVESYIEKQSAFAIGGISVDMAAWNLGAVESLLERFGNLVESLLNCLIDPSSAIGSHLKRVLLQVHFSSQTYLFEQNIDLSDFCSLLIEELKSLENETGFPMDKLMSHVSDACKSVIEEIDRCVLQSGFSGGEFQYSNGISLFFPWSLSSYEVSRYDYEQLSFVQNYEAGSLWNQFLQLYLGTINRRKVRE